MLRQPPSRFDAFARRPPWAAFWLMRFLLALLALLLTACAPQVKLTRCNGVLVSPTEVVTAAHCLSAHDGDSTYMRLPIAAGGSPPGAVGRAIRATAIEVDRGRDVARMMLSEPVFSWMYATYREPTPGATGYVVGGCPLRAGSMFRVTATARIVAGDGVARWEWAVRDGQIACAGDSGSPILSDTEPGVYYGVVSRYERLRMRIGSTLVLLDAGATVYSGAGVE